MTVGLGPWLGQAWDETSIPLSAGCDLFLRYVTRTTALEYEDIRAGKARLIERGERFGEISQKVLTYLCIIYAYVLFFNFKAWFIDSPFWKVCIS